MVQSRGEDLVSFARKLQKAASFADLLDIAREEVQRATGYRHAWLIVADTDDAKQLRLIEVSGERRELVWDVAPVLEVKGDAFLEELIASEAPVVIVDARIDPRTNKEIVGKLQNRTIINIPLRLLDKPFGIFGLGTFGDEGCRIPTDAQLDYLVAMTQPIVVAASRMRFVEERLRAEKERQEYERRLLKVQKLESLGMLAGGIAHDFNNLLTVIMASAALMQEQLKDSGVESDLESIVAAATRGKDLTRQLLAMSRAQDLAMKPLDLNVQMRKLIQLARRILPENIEVDFVAGSALPLIEADAGQIDQVLMNLFINACDAMPDGGRLTIETEHVVVNGKYTETHPLARPGRYVLATITDTGVGMAPEVRERIFEPFFTTKGHRAGTGLGLATAYGIVHQHKGMIHCYSEVGVGSSFKIYLPATERVAAQVGTKLEGPVPSGSEHILVAEDDELVRVVAIRILERAGYRVLAVHDGDAACRAVAEEAFDLLILDVVTPGSPCRDVVARVRMLRPGARILLSSGYTAGANIVALSEQTGLQLLRKPYNPDEMLRAVRGALDARTVPPPGG